MIEAGRGFRDLVAWQRGMDLVEMVYAVTRGWPAEERFGLVAQVRRAAVSVPSNIAEGNARFGSREFLHHASIAFGSLAEVETQVLLATRLGYLDADAAATVDANIIAVRRPLLGLLKSLRPSSD